MLESLLLIGALLVAFGLVSERLSSTPLTAPMVFVAVGMSVGAGGLGWIDLGLEEEGLHHLGEITLVLILFGDASRIDLRALRREASLPARLLGIGLPLSIAAGAAVAKLVMPFLSWAEAAALGAMLAPTDAALGQAVVSMEAVPSRIRQALNVESGLNDGIAVPVVMLFLSLAAMTGDGKSAIEWARFAGLQITLGPAVGIVVGWLGAKGLGKARELGWVTEGYLRLIGVGLALLTYPLADLVGGNGFIAAFVGGLIFGNTGRDEREGVTTFLEAEAQFLMLLVFTALGAILMWPALEHATWRAYLYAGLSLTVIRVVPVAISLMGTGLKPISLGFLGWFGPRGLATVIFALVLVDRTGIEHGHDIYCTMILTVLGSVVLHGASAAPGAAAYARRMQPKEHEAEHAEAAEHPLRCG